MHSFYKKLKEKLLFNAPLLVPFPKPSLWVMFYLNKFSKKKEKDGGNYYHFSPSKRKLIVEWKGGHLNSYQVQTGVWTLQHSHSKLCGLIYALSIPI